MRTIKVLTMNIWRYYHWETRKDKLIKFLKEIDADIIFIQEGAYDERLKDKFENQIDEINKELKYESAIYSPMTKMNKWHEKEIDWEMNYGLAMLSKFKIIGNIYNKLPFGKKVKEFGFLHSQVIIDDKKINLINVHFENTSEGSEQHLNYVLDYCKKNNINSIIAGDFNFLDTDKLIEICDSDYHISYKIKNYKSFYPTEFSHTKEPITLDYVIAKKDSFFIEKVDCLNVDVTDHKPVLVEVKI